MGLSESISISPNWGGKLSASQKVEKYIRQSVYEGHLNPRERIIEGDLARHLGVSRGTVREGLLRLERDGLIVITSRRGTFIRHISMEEIQIMFDIRGRLEGLCVRYMRQANKPEAPTALREALRRLKAGAAKNNQDQFFYADMELHRTIWRLSGQPQLHRVLNMVMGPFIFQIARFYTSKVSLKDSAESHERYIDTILKAPLGRVERKVQQYFDRLSRQLSLPIY